MVASDVVTGGKVRWNDVMVLGDALCQRGISSDGNQKQHEASLIHRACKSCFLSLSINNVLIPIGKLTWAPSADERKRIDFIYYQDKGLEVVERCLFGLSASIVCGERQEERTGETFLPPLGTWPTDYKGLWTKFRLE